MTIHAAVHWPGAPDQEDNLCPQGRVHPIREAYPAALNKEGVAALAGYEVGRAVSTTLGQ